MCPACIASSALMAAGAASTVGLTALTVKLLQGIQPKNKAKRRMSMAQSQTVNPRVVSQAEWLEARKDLLRKEKEFTRARDALSAERRKMPWVKVEKEYVFDTPGGTQTLSGLFGGKSQLIVYHFMFGPGWEQGCPSCSFLADHFDPSVIHLAQRDVAFLAVSRATLNEIEAFKKRLGWHFNWVSSNRNDFNRDFHVYATKHEIETGTAIYNYSQSAFPSDERPGASVFFKDKSGNVFHTYSTYGRGLDILIGAYNYLDLVPRGRDEEGLPHGMAWVRHHDRYSDAKLVGLAGGK
jgi:predicted dithiol-disulfide oxidoreductase (DUF899 family)